MTSPSKSIAIAVLSLLSYAIVAQDAVVWHGGISEEERALAPDAGTRLVFFVSAGSFLSDIAVNITNSSGQEVVNVTTNGPWLYLNLPSGTYDVRAQRRNGDVQSLKVDIDENADQEFAFMFPGD